MPDLLSETVRSGTTEGEKKKCENYCEMAVCRGPPVVLSVRSVEYRATLASTSAKFHCMGVSMAIFVKAAETSVETGLPTVRAEKTREGTNLRNCGEKKDSKGYQPRAARALIE